MSLVSNQELIIYTLILIIMNTMNNGLVMSEFIDLEYKYQEDEKNADKIIQKVLESEIYLKNKDGIQLSVQDRKDKIQSYVNKFKHSDLIRVYTFDWDKVRIEKNFEEPKFNDFLRENNYYFSI